MSCFCKKNNIFCAGITIIPSASLFLKCAARADFPEPFAPTIIVLDSLNILRYFNLSISSEKFSNIFLNSILSSSTISEPL